MIPGGVRYFHSLELSLAQYPLNYPLRKSEKIPKLAFNIVSCIINSWEI